MRAMAGAFAEATMKSPRALARSGLPNTGAATNSWPAAACARAKCRHRSGLTELIEMWIAPAASVSTSPPSPRVTCVGASSLGNEVTTTGQEPRPARSSTGTAPRAPIARPRSWSRSNTFTSSPSAIKLPTNASPMRPRPTTLHRSRAIGPRGLAMGLPSRCGVVDLSKSVMIGVPSSMDMTLIHGLCASLRNVPATEKVLLFGAEYPLSHCIPRRSSMGCAQPARRPAGPSRPAL